MIEKLQNNLANINIEINEQKIKMEILEIDLQDYKKRIGKSLIEDQMTKDHESILKNKEQNWENLHEEYKKSNDQKYINLKQQLDGESQKLVSEFEKKFITLKGNKHNYRSLSNKIN